MARSQPTRDVLPGNPDVKFERTDIEFTGIVGYTVVLVASILIVILSMLWFGRVLFALERSKKPNDLPPAATDKEHYPPEPRLEALDDIRDGKVKLFPPRAKEYFAPQNKQLKEGSKEAVPMERVLKEIKLPVRATGDRTAPTEFTIRLPSKAASGRVETGGL